ncbi:MAG: hypothetical protein ACKPJD_38425, partial [Planctomycetaceae bacterium]
MILLASLITFAASANAVQPPKQDGADPATELPLQLKSGTPAEFREFADSLQGRRLWVSKLSTRMYRGKQVFDATAEPNTKELAWFVHANLTADEFAEKQKKYSADGFVLHSSQILTVRSSRLHLGLWIQDAAAKTLLQLPAGEIPESGSTGAHLEPLNKLLRGLLRE